MSTPWRRQSITKPGWPSPATPPWSQRSGESEGNAAFHHERLDLPAVANVGRGEVVVHLLHPLGLEQDRRDDEPAGGELRPVYGDLARHARQRPLRDVVPAGHVQLVAVEAVEGLTSVLTPVPALGLADVLSADLFDVGAELDPAELEERVNDPGVLRALV